jgi:hypothetical protein
MRRIPAVAWSTAQCGRPRGSKSLSLGRGFPAVSDSAAIRSPHVRDPLPARRVLRHHEVLGSDDRYSAARDSSTLRSPHVRGIKDAGRAGARGVAFWGGAADMNSMRPPDLRFADRFIA